MDRKDAITDILIDMCVAYNKLTGMYLYGVEVPDYFAPDMLKIIEWLRSELYNKTD